MKVAVLSASTRINNNTIRVSKFLSNFLSEKHSIESILLDMAVYKFPVMEEVIQRHPSPPEGLIEFQNHIVSADSVLFVSPEYNGTYTPSLKNAVDYLKNREFSKKPIGVVSVSNGMLGGIRAALQMQNLVLGVGGYCFPQMLTVPQVQNKFDEAGNLVDEAYQKNIDTFLGEFLWLSKAVFEYRNK